MSILNTGSITNKLLTQNVPKPNPLPGHSISAPQTTAPQTTATHNNLYGTTTSAILGQGIGAQQTGLTAQGVADTIAQHRAMTLNVPDTVPSTMLDAGVNRQDVLDQRTNMENEMTASQQFAQYLSSQGDPNAGMIADFMFPQADPRLTEAREQQRGLIGQAGDFLTGMMGFDSVGRRNELAEQSGLAGAQAELAASNERLARLRGEQMKIRPQIEGEAGQTRIGAEARLNPVERQLTAEIGAEALVQAALAGNVEMIQGNIDRLMELEFGDKDRDLKIFEQRIGLEQARIASLEGEGKAEAEARLQVAQIMLQDRKDAMQAQKQEKRDLMSFALDYLKATGDGAGAANIMKGDMASAVAQYGGAFAPQVGGTTAQVKPMTNAELDAFETSYGWRPPLGVGLDQAIQYMRANPNSTPQELATALYEAYSSQPSQTLPVSDVISQISDGMTTEQRNLLFKKAKDAGQASFWTGKKKDVARYLNTPAIRTQIENATAAGLTPERIIEMLIR